MEIWKDIKGYEGIYKVSNLGRVKSLKWGKERILKLSINTGGYYYIILSNGTKKGYMAHRLEALAFIPNPENKRTINHKNGIKTDNRLVNLEWATDSENQLHAFNTGIKEGTNKGRYGSNHTRSIVVLQYSLDGEFITEYGSQIEASVKTGIHKQGIHEACKGKLISSGGFLWKKK